MWDSDWWLIIITHEHYIVKNISLYKPLLLHSVLIIWREMCQGLDNNSDCPAQAMSTCLLQTTHTATIHCLCQLQWQNTFKTLNMDSNIDICALIIQATGINIYLIYLCFDYCQNHFASVQHHTWRFCWGPRTCRADDLHVWVTVAALCWPDAPEPVRMSPSAPSVVWNIVALRSFVFNPQAVKWLFSIWGHNSHYLPQSHPSSGFLLKRFQTSAHLAHE